MPPVHHQTFKLADMPESRLLMLADEINDTFKDPKELSDVDRTGHLIAAAFQLIAQAEFSELITSKEALDYSKQIVERADGVQEAQVNAPVNGEPAAAVFAVNRQIMAVLRNILNKVSALKTRLALKQFEESIVKREQS